MPNKLIEKRTDKLMDYESAKTEMEKTRPNERTKEVFTQIKFNLNFFKTIFN